MDKPLETLSREYPQDWNSRVEIVSEETVPPISPIPLTVHYLESGVQRTVTFQTRPAVYFDSIVTAIAHEVLPSVPRPQITLRSPRDVARLGYHTARAVEASIRPPMVMRKPVFDTRTIEPNNMAHLLLEIIPYSLYARRAVGPEVAFLFYKLEKRFCELLNIFGLVPIFERRRIEADVVRICGTRGLALYDLQLQYNTLGSRGVSLVPLVYSDMDFSSSTKFDKVFLARRGPRALLNHSDVEETVSRFGYRTVFMEDFSLLDQLSIGAQAKHVVAIHGAAMSFLITNRQIDSIVELVPPNCYLDVFRVVLGARVRHYEQIISRFDRARAVQHSRLLDQSDDDNLRSWLALKYSAFAIDTSLLANLLSNIH